MSDGCGGQQVIAARRRSWAARLTLLFGLLTAALPASFAAPAVAVGRAVGSPRPAVGALRNSAESTGEIVARRTATSKTFTTEVDGVFRTVVSSAPVHVVDDDGSWVEPDLTLSGTDGGALAADLGRSAVRVAESSGEGWLGELTLGADSSIRFGLASASAADESVAVNEVAADPVGSSAVSYADVTGGVDVVLEAAPWGIKESLVLEGPGGPDEFVVPLELEGLTARLGARGEVELVDIPDEADPGSEDGLDTPEPAVVARIPAGWMADSAAPEPSITGGVRYELRDGSLGTELVVSLDRAWLEDPARVFPVVVDPTVTTSELDDTYVSSAFTGSPGANNENYTQLWIGKGAYYTNRSFLHFDDLAGLAGATVTSADLELYEVGTCTSGFDSVRAYGITEPWSGDLIPQIPAGHADPGHSMDPPAWWPGPSVSSPVTATVGCASNTWTSMSVTGLVTDLLDGSPRYFGIGLRAGTDDASEAAANKVRYFRSGNSVDPPKLTITWTAPSSYRTDRMSLRTSGEELAGDAQLVNSPATAGTRQGRAVAEAADVDSSAGSAVGPAVVFGTDDPLADGSGGKSSTYRDVFVAWRGTDGSRQVEQVSVKSDGSLPGLHSQSGVITDDGDKVAFDSTAALVPADENGLTGDVYLRDRGATQAAGTTSLVSRRHSDGKAGDASSWGPSIDAAGTVVAFSSNATNLVSTTDSNAKTDVYLFKPSTNSMELVSAPATTGTEGHSRGPDVAPDASTVVFESNSPRMTAESTNSSYHVYARTGIGGSPATVLVDRATDSWSTPGDPADGEAVHASVSNGGRWVVFESTATNLAVPTPGSCAKADGTGGTETCRQVYVRDTVTGTTSLVSATPSGIAANQHSRSPSISADGRYVSFRSKATDLLPSGDPSISGFGAYVVFVRDLHTGVTTLVPGSPTVAGTVDGAAPNADANPPSMSVSGRYVVQATRASNLVGQDNRSKRDENSVVTNYLDVILRDRQLPATTSTKPADWFWRPSGITGGGFQNSIAVRISDGRLALGSDTAGLHVSTDAAATWSGASAGLTADNGTVTRPWMRRIASVAWHPSSANDLYALAGQQNISPGAALLRFDAAAGVWYVVKESDTGFTFEVDGGGPNADPDPKRAAGKLIGFFGSDDLAFGSKGKVVIRRGGTWSTVALPDAAGFVTGLVIDPEAGPSGATMAYVTQRDSTADSDAGGLFHVNLTTGATPTRLESSFTDGLDLAVVDEGASSASVYVAGNLGGLTPAHWGVFRYASTLSPAWSDLTELWDVNGNGKDAADTTVDGQLRDEDARWSALDAYRDGSTTKVFVAADVLPGVNCSDPSNQIHETTYSAVRRIDVGSSITNSTLTTGTTVKDRLGHANGPRWWITGDRDCQDTRDWDDAPFGSTDGGAQPEQMLSRHQYLPSQLVVRRVSGQADQIFIAGRGGVWRSVDAGGTWFPANQGLSVTGDNDVEVDPTDPTRVVVANTDWTLFASTGDGAGISDRLLGPPVMHEPTYKNGFRVTYDTHATGSQPRLYAGFGSQQSPTAGGNVFTHLAPHAPGARDSWANGLTLPTNGSGVPYENRVVGLTVGRSGTDTVVLAALAGAGLFRWTTSGGWTGPIEPDLGGNVDTARVEFAWSTSSTVYAYDTRSGLWRSTNGGVTWVHQWARSSSAPGTGYMVASPTDPDDLYFSMADQVCFMNDADSVPDPSPDPRNGQSCLAGWAVALGSTGSPTLSKPGALSVSAAGRVYVAQREQAASQDANSGALESASALYRLSDSSVFEAVANDSGSYSSRALVPLDLEVASGGFGSSDYLYAGTAGNGVLVGVPIVLE